MRWISLTGLRRRDSSPMVIGDNNFMAPPSVPPAFHFRSLSSCGHNRPSPASSAAASVKRSASARLTRQHTTRNEVMLNDIVGSGVSAILYKWVNYGRGWRPRWFVLHDGVLSYYKIHGPDKLVLNREADSGAMVIGGGRRGRGEGEI